VNEEAMAHWVLSRQKQTNWGSNIVSEETKVSENLRYFKIRTSR